MNDTPSFRRPLRGDGRLALGVCAGLGRRWDLQPRTIRLAFAVMAASLGAGLLVYAALALVMPGDGASDAEAGWRSDVGRSIAEALVVLAGVLAVGIVSAIAAGLAVFGLSAVALLLATAALGGVILLDHERVWMLGVTVLALALPAAAVELAGTSIARQVTEQRIAITRPQDVDPAGYRAGLGRLLIDLRDFDAEERTTTTIRARADVRPLVVALPTGRCFNLEVEYALDRSWLSGPVFDARRDAVFVSSAAGYASSSLVRDRDTGHQATAKGALVAYGKLIERQRGRYERPVANAAAPTLRLQLESGRSQIYVRDYPLNLDPLDGLAWPRFAPPSLARVDEQLDLATQSVIAASTAASIASQRAYRSLTPKAPAGLPLPLNTKAGRLQVSGRATNGRIAAALAALRQHDRYPAQQAKRLAGACSSAHVVTSATRRLQRRLDRMDRVDASGARGARIASLRAYQAGMSRLIKELPQVPLQRPNGVAEALAPPPAKATR